MVPIMRQFIESVPDWSDSDAVAAAITNDPNVRPMNPEVEWDATGLGMFGVVAHGLYGLALFWREWVAAGESYVYEMREYGDIGAWGMRGGDARARVRGVV